MKIFSSLFITAFFVCFCFVSVSAEDIESKSVTVGGSTTVHNAFFKDVMQINSEQYVLRVEYLPSSSGRGVLALVNGKVDIAGISSNFESILEKLNRDRDVIIKAEDFVVDSVENTRVLLVVHPDNPLDQITREQAKSLFTGEIKDWSELGIDGFGAVKVVTEHPTGGVYNTVLGQLTDKVPLKEDTITMQNGPQVGIVVSQLPNGFGMLSDATPSEQKRAIKSLELDGFEIVQRMFLVTKRGEAEVEKNKILQFIKKLPE